MGYYLGYYLGYYMGYYIWATTCWATTWWGCPPPTCGEGPVGMPGWGWPAVTPVYCRRCFLRLEDASTLPVTTRAFYDGQLLGQADAVIAPT